MFNDVCSVRTWAGNWTINEQNLSACWLKMNPKYFQIIFFKIAVVITVINIYNRFFTKRVTNPGCHRIKVFRSKSTIPFYPSVTSWCGNTVVICLFTIKFILRRRWATWQGGSQSWSSRCIFHLAPSLAMTFLIWKPVGLTESIGCFLANGQTQSGSGEETTQ